MKRVPLRSHRRAFTLVELVISLGIASLLIAGLSSALFVSIQAMEPKEGPISGRAESLRSIQSLLSELHFARSVEQLSENSITFTLPDRTGDGLAERLHYEWSGQPGAPLTVEVNGNPPSEILPRLDRLAFVAETQTVQDDEGTERTRIVSLGIALQETGRQAAPLETLVRLLNRPEDPRE